jgi:hypothetical protein
VLPDVDEQVAVEQEADPAEYLPVLDALLAGRGTTDASGEGFAEGHRTPRALFVGQQPVF